MAKKRKSKKRKPTVPVGRVIGTLVTGGVVASGVLEGAGGSVLGSLQGGDLPGALNAFVQNGASAFSNPGFLIAAATPTVSTQIIGGILDKTKMNKSVDLGFIRLKGM